jgi:transcriptional regulator with XRE-family HTH domain
MMMGRRSVHDVDRALAQIVRRRRMALGLTQAKFAEALGVTYQQVHKYEAGHNRFSVTMLLRAIDVLGLSREAVFEEATRVNGESAAPNPRQGRATEATLMMAAYSQLSEKHRGAVRKLTLTLAGRKDEVSA